jgi:hypothetical protein
VQQENKENEREKINTRQQEGGEELVRRGKHKERRE